MWKAGSLNQFCSAFCFPQNTEESKEGAQLQQRNEPFGETGVWCEQTMINTVPSPKNPNFLDGILGADDKPVLVCSHTGWKRLVVNVCGALILKQWGDYSFPHLTCLKYRTLHRKHNADLMNSLVFFIFLCKLNPKQKLLFYKGLLHWWSHARVAEAKEPRGQALYTYLWCWRQRCRCESRCRWWRRRHRFLPGHWSPAPWRTECCSWSPRCWVGSRWGCGEKERQ